LTACLEKTVLSEKMIVENLSRVEESATKSTYKLGVRFERREKKGENSGPIFVPSSNYHKEEEALKPTKTHYPSNPKPSFKLKRDVMKETSKPREEAFACIFCGRAGHLDEFCFCRKRMVLINSFLPRMFIETEFRNASFDQFCIEHGVDQQFSAPHVPQQNGVME
jgi:hypothetical protein